MPPAPPWPRVLAYWQTSQLPRRPGVTPDEVENFQAKYKVVLPPDFLEYMLLTDGSTTDSMDNDMFRFWSLSEIVPVSEELNDSRGVIYPDRFAYPNCFVFADYLINSWLYAVKLTAEPGQPAPVYRVTGGEPAGGQIAPSFREFMTRYAEDPFSVSGV